jgi:glyoxylase-like metal-dependent hydrolase (beta-lactamase superfamily II)
MTSPVIELPDHWHFLERGWLSANNTLINTGDHSDGGWLMIDSGYFTHKAQTLALVQHTLAGAPLAHLVNTHLHSDHCGGNALLQSQFAGLRTHIPPGHADEVRSWDANALTYEPTGQQCERFDFTDVLQPGTVFRVGSLTLQVHAAAGHDPHSVILFEPEHRIVFSADALWENGFGVVFPALDGIQAFDEVGATLDLIESLNAQICIPGHGRVFTAMNDALQRARSRLAAFKADPAKHAQHGIRVLMKYRMLEVQHCEVDAFWQWVAATPYFQSVAQRFGAKSDSALNPRLWLEQQLAALLKGGTLRLDSGVLSNATD